MAIKGNWTITSVTYPGSDYIKVNSFQLADSKCFEGSSWKFVSVNNSGEAKKVRDGYVLKLAAQTEQSFQLIDKINVGTKATDVVYQFQKVN